MTDLDKQTATDEGSLKNPVAEAAEDGGQSSLKSETAAPPLDEAALLRAKKRRTVIIWLRITALLFAGFFLLSQCGMSKPKAKATIVESCIQNVPHAPKWQQDLAQRSLKDPDGTLVAQYCVCMWDEPLQKLSAQQIQSFAKIGPEQQLALLGGADAFSKRDAQCIANLGAKK